MKIIFLSIFFSCLFINSGFSQAVPEYDEIKLETKADYPKADTFALIASNYLLSTPYEKNSLQMLKSLQFIMKWMTGTPDYTFSLDNSIAKLFKGNDDLLGHYMACMTKFCLENKALSKDEKVVKLNALKLLISYCENPKYNLKMTKQLKKLAESNQKGELEEKL